MACGVPTIGPAWGGNTDFMNLNNSILVKGKMVTITDARFLNMQPQYSGQNWFDIDEAELSQSMRWVYDNQKEAQVVGARGAQEIKDKWTWEHTAEKIHKRLLEIDSTISDEKRVNVKHQFVEED
jgi:glycosyltransferase involved in cell wall biosynthesis